MGDTVYLKNGREIKGTILNSQEDEITIKSEGINLTIPQDQIERVVLEELNLITPTPSPEILIPPTEIVEEKKWAETASVKEIVRKVHADEAWIWKLNSFLPFKIQYILSDTPPRVGVTSN